MGNTSNSNLGPIVAIILAPFVALWLGNLVAGGSYITLLLIIAAIAGLLFLGLAQKHLLILGLVIATLDLWASPTGFKTAAIEQSGVLASALWLLVVWRKDFNPNAPTTYQRLGSWSFFRSATIVACAYAFLHFLFNKWYPYEPLAFGFNGAVKTYLSVYGPFLMIVVLTTSRLLYPVNAKYSFTILTAFSVAVIFDICIRLVFIYKYGIIQQDLNSGQELRTTSGLYIPLLNIWESTYTLRTIGPAATLVGSVFYLSLRNNPRKLLCFLLVLAGLFGSLISGGRASVLFSIIFLFSAALHAKRKAELMLAGGFVIIVFFVVIILPTSILKDSPYFVQRSVGMFRPDLKTKATGNIQGSTDMRKEYFLYAWDYWSQGDVRLMLIGRSVGSMDQQDVKMFVDYDPNVIFFAIKRLATHNGLTDTLLGWGAVGWALNIVVWISSAIMTFRLNREFSPGSHGDCWSFIAGAFMTFWIVYMHIGGSWVWAIAIWLVLVALAQTDGLRPRELKRRTTPTDGHDAEIDFSRLGFPNRNSETDER